MTMKKLELIESKDVLLVENKIKRLDYPTPKELFAKLPKRFDKKTVSSILGYFLKENMILMDNGQIVWIWNPIDAKRIFNAKGLIVV